MTETNPTGRTRVFRSPIQGPFGQYISPANVQATRGVCVDNNSVIFASGTSLYTCWTSVEVLQSQGPSVSDTLRVPHPVDNTEAHSLLSNIHSNEVQGIDYAVINGIPTLVSTDALGYVSYSTLDPNTLHMGTRDGMPPSPITADKTQIWAPGQGVMGGEAGWAHAVLNTVDPSYIAMARQFYGDLAIVNTQQEGKVVHCVHPLQEPLALQYLDTASFTEGNVVALAEGDEVSLWDFRGPTEKACVSRQTLKGRIFALDAHDNKIATAGEERTVTILDLRKQGLIADQHLPGVSKYECVNIRFAPWDTNSVFVSGLDNEILLHDWAGQSVMPLHSGVMGDSRWIGLDFSPDSSTLYGVTELASLYTVTNLQEYRVSALESSTASALDIDD